MKDTSHEALLLFWVGSQPFLIQHDWVREVFLFDPQRCRKADFPWHWKMRYRGESLPLVDFAVVLGGEASSSTKRHGIVFHDAFLWGALVSRVDNFFFDLPTQMELVRPPVPWLKRAYRLEQGGIAFSLLPDELLKAWRGQKLFKS